MLKGNDHQAVVTELVHALCQDMPRLDVSTVLSAVAGREAKMSTRIAPAIALPHARLEGIEGFVLAVGLSPGGVRWDIESNESPVHLVAMLIGDVNRPKDHIRALAGVADIFSRPDALKSLLGSASADELYRNLIGLQIDEEDAEDLPARRQSDLLVQHAARLAEELPAQAVIVMGAVGMQHGGPADGAKGGVRWILAAPPDQQRAKVIDGFYDEILEVPSRGLLGRQRVEVVILLCLLKQSIKATDTVVCLYGGHAPGQVDTVRVVDVAAQFGELWKLSDQIGRGDIEPSTLYRILQLANDLGIEGREGHPVGALFVLGDYERVATYCHQLVLNPFRGYTDAEMDILDPVLDETLKEFSQLDGAFLVRGDGIVMAAG
ncbi:MAG: PTS sugar transporter subunit IIA, partial [Verrucomicrobia bacterium]|nr:PTS sugar transporter subunit IIA [Verrucomicrobiota bacterium]